MSRASFAGPAAALILAVVSLACAPARAARIGEVTIDGLDEAMKTNVKIGLSLEDAKDKTVSAARLDYLLRVAEDETREGLEPFGYYSPQIEIRETPAPQAARARFIAAKLRGHFLLRTSRRATGNKAVHACRRDISWARPRLCERIRSSCMSMWSLLLS